MRARIQDHQVGHYAHSLELQHVPQWATLVHLRVRQVQTEDLQAMHRKSLSEFSLTTVPASTLLTRGSTSPSANPFLYYIYPDYQDILQRYVSEELRQRHGRSQQAEGVMEYRIV